MDTLFKDCFMNTNNLCLSFYGNISETISNPIVSSQMKREYKRSQKRQLEELVVPDEVTHNSMTMNFTKFVCLNVRIFPFRWIMMKVIMNCKLL